MLTLETHDDLPRLVYAGAEETLILEYRAFISLEHQSKAIGELRKDVPAMANSAGGRVIYGIGYGKAGHPKVKIDGAQQNLRPVYGNDFESRGARRHLFRPNRRPELADGGVPHAA